MLMKGLKMAGVLSDISQARKREGILTSIRGVRRAIKEAFILVSNLDKIMHYWNLRKAPVVSKK